ncbi:TPA: hypothetical protein N0F65_012639 [Lagenidium giganteum]|uniref:Uncharacterized protein n=1 Tax=Lagenidium giganteum TaxID=4803 RepID=A0AAV2YAS0_9STRA|nr:TPA: hypothetical protein N0F65_012639 [Lagenidium giganteum]
MWGIELVRSGAKIGEHMSRFGPRGKYAGLQSSDYIVLDFRRGVTDVRQDPRRATASFPIDDATGETRFGEVVVKYGEDDAVMLHLQP